MKHRLYKSKQIADLYGVSVDTLAYYERMGLISPERDPNNNYRLFGSKEIRRLSLVRELLGLGFSVKEASKFMSKKTSTQP